MPPGILKARVNDRRQVILTITCLLIYLACFPAGLVAEQKEPEPAQVLAPGWSELEFNPPLPGSYQLPPLGLAGDGEVLDSNGKATVLF